MDLIAIKYTNTLQNLPKLGFLVWKYAIWQPCSSALLTSSGLCEEYLYIRSTCKNFRWLFLYFLFII
jgi:hypothetical protein